MQSWETSGVSLYLPKILQKNLITDLGRAVNLPADPDSSADRLPSQDGKAPADELTRLERSEAALQKLEESYREAVDECLALRYKNAILEKILRDKGRHLLNTDLAMIMLTV